MKKLQTGTTVKFPKAKKVKTPKLPKPAKPTSLIRKAMTKSSSY